MNGGFGAVMQHGYIVTNAAAAAVEWAQRVGAGPFYVIDRMPMDQYFYRGVRTELELRLAFGYWEGLQIELIEPLGSADSLYSRALRDAPGKLNHCATVVSDIDRLLAQHGLHDRVIQSGKMPSGLKFVYLGNVALTHGEDTFCPECRRLVAERRRFGVMRVEARNGRCPSCGHDLYMVQRSG